MDPKIMAKVFQDLLGQVDDAEYSKKMKPKMSMLMMSKKKPMGEDDGMDMDKESEGEDSSDMPKSLRDLFGGQDESSDEEMGEMGEGKEDPMSDMDDEEEDPMVARMKDKMKSKMMRG